MDQLIRTTTEHFLSKLDDDREFFVPKELLESGFPDFLVKRIHLELIRNLQDSVKPPDTEWANMDTASVTAAWERFLDTIHEEVRLPASYANSVLESALGDILEMMVTPRAFLPEYLFGTETELDLDTIKNRCEWVVVYTYFSTAIPRFMEKRGREVLTIEQAVRIIERLDERVTAHYTSLNWGQLFEPWFQIMGEEIDSGLFAKFFRDKGKPGVARFFEVENSAINRYRLIEILSRPQLLEDDEEEVENLHSIEEKDEKAIKKTFDTEKKDVEKSGPDKKPSQVTADQSETGRSLYDSVKEKQEKTVIDQFDEPSEKRKNRKPEPDEKQEPVREEENLLARFRRVNEDEEQNIPLHSRLKNEASYEGDEESLPLHSRLSRPQEEETDYIPIWQRFSKETEGSAKGGKKSDIPAGGLAEIRKHVSDMEEEFVNELFGGDENAFLEALEEITRFKDWKQAGNYISREIFDRNMIDVYSDTAIYFTDRMQTYFLERK